MRKLRKRLVCSNRSDCDRNREAISKVISRYVEKMRKRGWMYSYESSYPTSGNSYFQYEAYITLYKPNLKSKVDVEFIRENGLS